VYAVPLLSVSAWGFMLSTLTRNSAASIVGMLAFSFANQIIGFLPNIPTSVTHWLLTDQFTAWQAALGTTVDRTPLVRAVGVSLLYAVPPVVVSAWWFRRRDVLV
jgi:ABC-2 type transport system permease protein